LDINYVTLGFIGYPNVGKSTLMNALVGKKVCSTSRTPGHTKWRQTYFLSDKLMLCDCPGLIFPAVDMPKQIQIICCIFPIAQCREPYSSVQLISERVPLEELYKLEPIDNEPWSAWNICEAYANKRGYSTTRGRPDCYRAGNEILRDHLDGKIVLYFLPNTGSISYTTEEEIKEEKKEKKEYQFESSSSENVSEEEGINISTNPFDLLREDSDN